ncbi:MAG TPA: hypothetical protein RMH99_27955, partial [Sandaracinaceae bacterium LLY-WYZ-13_1]|nr:hypothetical protein [Sandaracinaceae bacterium LLY-WYZ-13_1]
AHDRVGSRGARAQTRAQVRVELLAARARAAASPEGARLARIIAAAEAEGHALAADPEELAAWFAGRPSPEAARLLGLSDEIPTTPRP